MFKIIVNPLVKNVHEMFTEKLKVYGFYKKGDVYIGKVTKNLAGVDFYKRVLAGPQLRVTAVRIEGKKTKTI